MFRILQKNPAAVAVGHLHLHLLRFNNCRNGSVSTPYPYLLYLLQLSTATTTARTETTTTRSRRSSSSQSSSSPISSTEYLVKSLGLSPDTITKAKGIKLKSTKNADSVLALFKDYGFTPSDMATIFSKCPRLLSQKLLEPKIDFFVQNGISGDALVHILTTDPYILIRSLRRIIIPGISFLNNFFGHDSERLISQLYVKRGTWVLQHFSESVPANVQTLRDYGVPDSIILKAMTPYRALDIDTEVFSEAVKEAKEMGIDPWRTMFIQAVSVIMWMKKEKLVPKLELLKSYGWTEEEVRALFVRHPNFFKSSVKKLKIALEFFVKKLNWTAQDVYNYHTALLFSFENRILPRYAVLELLIHKGLVKKTAVGNAMKAKEDAFLRKFVHKYQDEIPQLLEIYRTKMMAVDTETETETGLAS